MKHFILIILIALNFNAFAQDADKTVTLVVSGSGKTQDEAKQNALRSAIEQAFGTFISSKTEILNDNFVKDEIVSVANGNIQKFDIISEVQIPDGGFATTLNAYVSITNLTSFAKGKGVEVEFKGGLFAANIKMQKLNEISEIASIRNLCLASKPIIDNMFDYTISTSEPKSVDGHSNEWEVLLNVGISTNSNFELFKNYIFKSLTGISLTSEDVESYKLINKRVFPFELITKDTSCVLFYRNEASLALIQDLIWYLDFSQVNFLINDGVSEISLYQNPKNRVINDYYHKECSYWEFADDRSFETKWPIYFVADFIDYTPPWKNGGASRGSTYELTQKNIKNKIKEVLKYYEKKIENSKSKEELDVAIKEATNKIATFPDSATAFCFNKGIGYPGKNSYREPKKVVNGIDLLFSINLNPPALEFAKLILRKTYSTDELSKIETFSVKAAEPLSKISKSYDQFKDFSKSIEKALAAINSLKFNSSVYISESNRNDEEKYINDFLKLNNMSNTSLSSGLIIHLNKKGNGLRPKYGQNVTIHYNAYLLNGNKFESSDDYGQKSKFILGTIELIKSPYEGITVIEGLNEGIALMEVGSRATLIIPSKLAYGTKSHGFVPPHSALIVEVKLIAAE